MSSSPDPDRGRPPKRINAALGLYDMPVYRDWLAWWTVAWIVVAGLAIGFPTKGSARSTSLPPWLDAALAAIVFGILFGFFPAYLRLLIRRARFRRARSVPGAGSDHGMPLWASQPRIVPEEAQRSEVQHPDPVRPAAPEGTPGRFTSPAPGPAAASPIDALDTSKVRDSETMSQARLVMPYPVARAVRAVQQATDMRDTYEAVLRAAEALSVVLGVTAAAWARQYEVTTPQLQELQQAFDGQGVSQGHWIQVVASVERPMSRHSQAVPGMTEALKLGKAGSGLVADLKDLVGERNRWAHGGAPRNGLEAAERLQITLPIFERALERALFLAESPWLLTTDVKLRRREGDFQIHASRAMGDHPDFERVTFTGPQPLAEDVFYLRTPDGAIDMTPLVVMRPCPTCHQQEVAYADRIDRRDGVALKTFDRGHVLYDGSLVEELRNLVHQERPNAEPETA